MIDMRAITDPSSQHSHKHQEHYRGRPLRRHVRLPIVLGVKVLSHSRMLGVKVLSYSRIVQWCAGIIRAKAGSVAADVEGNVLIRVGQLAVIFASCLAQVVQVPAILGACVVIEA